ncbi:MAG: hypothetical protein II349_04030 [Akkermansia sp.]|nr:hypothetical protein [Akkermansia sp.]
MKQVLIFAGILIVCAFGGYFVGKLVGHKAPSSPMPHEHHCHDPHCSHQHGQEPHSHAEAH